MILEVAILTIAVSLASVLNFFIMGAIVASVAESRKDQEEPKPFPYNALYIANAVSWLLLSICLSFLGYFIWKSMMGLQEDVGFLRHVLHFLSGAFKNHSNVYFMFLGISTISFIILGALITEKPTEFPVTLDTSIKMSFVAPHHKVQKNKNKNVSREVKIFQMINLIILAVSACMPSVLSVSLT
jgi:mannose/fructose/N-acetylgalactosamine-specific phosphotransferase system component IIC